MFIVFNWAEISLAKFFIFLLVVTNSSFADIYETVSLKNIDAASIKTKIQPLLTETVVVDDGNRLLLRGPNADVKQLLSLIQTLDKSPRQLKIWVYRGKHPELESNPATRQQWSTDVGDYNRSDFAIVSEATTLLIMESNLIVTERQSYRELGQAYKNKEPHKISRYQGNYSAKNPQFFTRVIKITPTLLSGKKLSIETVIALPDVVKNTVGDIAAIQESARFTDVTLSRIVRLDEWVFISRSSQESNRPALKGDREVSSTQLANDFDNTVWVKFQLQ